jgi:methylase of polypeptide subunit release factors
MPLEATPLFRPEVIRPHVDGFDVPANAKSNRERLTAWLELLGSPEGAKRKETELLPDYLTDVFHRILGYRGPAERQDARHTLSREKLVEVDGKFADAVLGSFGAAEQFVVAVEGKGPRDPLERPFSGRRMSAVDQAYRYAINLPCDWLVVTNLREIRVYHKGSTQRTYERFLLEDLSSNDFQFRKFVFLLGAERVVPPAGRSHLYDLLSASERAGDRLTQEFYRAYAAIRHDLLAALLEANPDRAPQDVLSAAQRLLDRVLFIAFAEDRYLLPEETLAEAYKHRDPYNPRPVWDNFKGLFKAIDQGNQALGIPRYNGGLFAEHGLLDRQLVVPDAACLLLKRLGDYNYGAAGDGNGEAAEEHLVDVEILGHIFEQSIEDLEAIRSEIEGGGEVSRATSKRKREGAFYTPAYVTRYIVTEALGPVLRERFERLREAHQHEATGTSIAVLRDPRAYEVETLNNPQRDTLIAFWEAWIEDLKTVRILDPACGSGAFLIEVFDALYEQYEQAVGHLTELRRGEFAGFLLDPDRTILENNVYGVDLNEEAVEIARLSIWIKTAARGKVLTDLDHNVQVGNSVIDDPSLDSRAFDWWGAFPEVEAQGGFDVVVGNPPYVRAEMLSEFKPFLESRYVTYAGTADLYVYFYELGVRLLRPGGRLSYIVTNKWLRAGYAARLRRFFQDQTWVEEVVDLGHAKQIFADADVFPSLLRVRKPLREEAAPQAFNASVIPRDELRVQDFGVQLKGSGFSMSQADLKETAWTLEPPALQALLHKVNQAGAPLSSYLPGDPKYGLKTGYNEAFLVTDEKKEQLVAADPASEVVFGRYLRGQDIKRWSSQWASLWIILLKSSGDQPWPWSNATSEREAEDILARTYPAIHQHLKGHEERLRRRSDQGHFWWELRSCDYYDLFKAPNIVHTDITWRAEFAFVDEPLYLVNTAYMWPSDDLYLLGVVNSPLMWSYMWRHAQHGKDEALRIIHSFVSTLPIAEGASPVREGVEAAVREVIASVRRENEAVTSLHDWLRFEFGVEKPGQKLGAPHELDSDTFVAEVKKRREGKPTVSAAELRRLREEYDRATGPLRANTAVALDLESRISDLVNQAYGLTEEEVEILWKTAPPRMPRVKRPVPSGIDT